MTASSSLRQKSSHAQPFLSPFEGRAAAPPPIWLMRQAGRYLPEYRQTRTSAGGFLDLCYSPALATEVTLQPIRRYGFDAAILFSDILVVPDALGQSVRFAEGEGPRLDPIRDGAGLARLDPERTDGKFNLVFESVSRIRAALPGETALIGFCGAPWTVATYMAEGRGSSDQAEARLWAYRDRAGFKTLIDILVETSIAYLSGQAEAGANVLQIFDSWSGSLPDDEFESWVIAPTRRIVSSLRAHYPEIPVIGFPRGAGLSALDYAARTGVAGLGCDTSVPLGVMGQALGESPIVLQGNLDPLLLVSGGDAMIRRAKAIVQSMRGRPFVFNLGHGIVPETPPDNVAALVRAVREKA